MVRRNVIAAMKEIYISEQAFLGLIFATAEVYRRECYGLMFGYALEEKIIVEGAIAYQTAERKFSTVALYERQSRVIQGIISRFPKYEYLGEFHSHPDYRGRAGLVGLTPDDLVDLQEHEIHLVIAINPRRRGVAWGTNADGTLSGTLGDHHFRIGGYHIRYAVGTRPQKKAKGDSRPRPRRPRIFRARVSCPYAVGLLSG